MSQFLRQLRGKWMSNYRKFTRRGDTDHAVSVQVLAKSGLDRFERGAGSRHESEKMREVVAVAVGSPDSIFIGAWNLPGNVISARCLHRADRQEAAKLACPRHNICTLIF